MARWDPGAEERLKRAALELYLERGYDNVTVTHIAERAGLTRRSYFRYFPDKREVLFAGSERLPPALAEAVLTADPNAAPLAAVLDALARVGAQLVEHVGGGAAERRAVIDASPELRERERTKAAAITEAIRDALIQRQVNAATAELVAQLATVACDNAFRRWIGAKGRASFGSCLDAVTGELRAALAGT
ncbi:helix-turn-helix domain-containing protein [Streptantibioticus parmotrematis]|uniref:TetR/AcrR family transcriptional regulator n=1 Tax=Streptantibioticus parmotrematis TaxID=2873249 RepID=UPI0033D1C14F